MKQEKIILFWLSYLLLVYSSCFIPQISYLLHHLLVSPVRLQDQMAQLTPYHQQDLEIQDLLVDLHRILKM